MPKMPVVQKAEAQGGGREVVELGCPWERRGCRWSGLCNYVTGFVIFIFFLVKKKREEGWNLGLVV